MKKSNLETPATCVSFSWVLYNNLCEVGVSSYLLVLRSRCNYLPTISLVLVSNQAVYTSFCDIYHRQISIFSLPEKRWTRTRTTVLLKKILVNSFLHRFYHIKNAITFFFSIISEYSILSKCSPNFLFHL